MCASDEVSLNNRKSARHTFQREQLVHLHQFFNSLPKLPSHYGRINTSKLFLEQNIDSLTQLYNLYCEKIQNYNGKPVSRIKFSSVFHELNLSLYTLQKDQCDVCAKHEVGNISEEDWIQHQNRKDRARKEKEDDKEISAQQQYSVLIMDLQAVKVAPCIQASAFYYKTKLTCHNFTVYNITSNHYTCYWFSEVDTDLSASTFAILIIDYLKCHCANEKQMIIYSDGCNYQNRNFILGNALLDHAIKSGQTIIQKFLERSHTQMECDSVHSTIERKLKKRPIHLPSNYVTITKQARKKPFPYEAKWMDFDAFTDYSAKSLQRLHSLRPEQRKVTDIRCLRYSPDGCIEFKINFHEDLQVLPQRCKVITSPVQWPSMHTEPRKISSQKYSHLQQLKPVLPRDYHAFYDSLPHE
ncbi:uncharacterized protein LOC134529234 [Bacillus rossius redtenbacheri]|uniref:uncharacterized protein LOC134529234 n=1 Tax=Bacillus rossius redtenbacheri TaxID=93214 RepID=UPI002FDD68D1